MSAQIYTFPPLGSSFIRGAAMQVDFPSASQQPEASFEFGNAYSEEARFRFRGTMEGELAVACGGVAANLGAGPAFDITLQTHQEADLFTLTGSGRLLTLQVDLED